MVVIGVTAALVLPSIGAGREQREVRRTVRAFVSAVRLSSSRAIGGRRPIELRIWPDEGRFEVERPDGPAGDAGLTHGAEAARNSDGVDLPEFAEFETVRGGRVGDEDEIIYDFFPTGGSSGGRISLEFRTRGGTQKYSFVINPLLSSVSIENES